MKNTAIIIFVFFFAFISCKKEDAIVPVVTKSLNYKDLAISIIASNSLKTPTSDLKVVYKNISKNTWDISNVSTPKLVLTLTHFDNTTSKVDMYLVNYLEVMGSSQNDLFIGNTVKQIDVAIVE